MERRKWRHFSNPPRTIRRICVGFSLPGARQGDNRYSINRVSHTTLRGMRLASVLVILVPKGPLPNFSSFPPPHHSFVTVAGKGERDSWTDTDLSSGTHKGFVGHFDGNHGMPIHLFRQLSSSQAKFCWSRFFQPDRKE